MNDREPMDFKIEADEPLERKPVPPVRDFTSTQFRMRFASLLVALLVVLFMMQEARKPENWEWMGFEKADAEKVEGELPSEGESDAVPLDVDDAEWVELDLESGRPIKVAQGELPAQAVTFWKKYVSEIGDAKKLRVLFLMLQQARTGSGLTNPDLNVARKLLVDLERSRVSFHAEMFDKISFMEDSSEKERLSSGLYDCKTVWTEKVFPGLRHATDGEDLTLSQLKSIEQLQSELDRLALEMVLDEAPLNRPLEGPATIRLWELVETETGDAPPVKQIQLSGQPEVYRGRRIQVNGWMRRIEKKRFPVAGGGTRVRYVGWFRPCDSNQMPYCFYLNSIPDDLEQAMNERITMDLNRYVQVTGRFFKIRTYESAAGELLACPLIFANGFKEVQQVGAEASIDELWRPGWEVWIMIWILLPLLATAIAVWVYRGTTLRRYQPGKKLSSEIGEQLTSLEKDPGIQSDAEHVREMSKKLTDDPS